VNRASWRVEVRPGTCAASAASWHKGSSVCARALLHGVCSTPATLLGVWVPHCWITGAEFAIYDRRLMRRLDCRGYPHVLLVCLPVSQRYGTLGAVHSWQVTCTVVGRVPHWSSWEALRLGS
jgi:hypothetical protein